jgi:nucleoside-diphosphate kinase
VVSRTFVICKPDAVERGLAGEILARLERKSLRLVAVELRTIDGATARRHYAEHEGKPFFADLVAFITRGPSLLVVAEGTVESTWKVVRTMIGSTDPAESSPGTIRGDYAIRITDNLVHGSDSETSAQREIGIFFPGLS